MTGRNFTFHIPPESPKGGQFTWAERRPPTAVHLHGVDVRKNTVQTKLPTVQNETVRERNTSAWSAASTLIQLGAPSIVRPSRSMRFLRGWFHCHAWMPRNRSSQAVESRSANDWARKGARNMTNVDDAELQRLKDAVRVACKRVTQISQKIADPAAIKAAEDLCAEQPPPLPRIRQRKLRPDTRPVLVSFA
jgi:hypothetical protein